MVNVLVLLALACGFFGVLLTTVATHGVGLVGAGCLFAILARMVQSDKQHQALMKQLEDARRAPSSVRMP